MRFVNRSARRLGRAVFHSMVRFGPKLEKRQAVLGRLVDIGAELLAIAATCSRAQAMVAENPGDQSPVELADAFSRLARRRVKASFRGIWSNEDVRIYRVAQNQLAGKYEWLEQGIVREG
jgi:hypothetical protein